MMNDPKQKVTQLHTMSQCVYDAEKQNIQLVTWILDKTSSWLIYIYITAYPQIRRGDPIYCSA